VDTDRLRQKLRNSFPLEPIPEHIEMRSVHASDSIEATEGFMEKAWDSISAALLKRHYDAFFYLTPEAYRYYLAGLLDAQLRGEDVGLAIDAALDQLIRSPDYESWDASFCSRWMGFNVNQLETIKEICIWLADNGFFPTQDWERERISETLKILILLSEIQS